jgi:hypothetical protein
VRKQQHNLLNMRQFVGACPIAFETNSIDEFDQLSRRPQKFWERLTPTVRGCMTLETFSY